MRFFFLCLILTTKLYACSCIGSSKISVKVKQCDVLIIGTVIDIKNFEVNPDNLPEIFSIKLTEYTFEIKTVFKGELKSRRIKIISGRGNGDCGVKFLKDSEYIVYGKYSDKYSDFSKKTEPFIYTDICMKSILYEVKEEIKIRRYLKKTNQLRKE